VVRDRYPVLVTRVLVTDNRTFLVTRLVPASPDAMPI
jgi:hypothetical protein